ncbi:Uncharacterised protein [Bordetella pertussis]|nr:Uncharacterised protein [Bordetella pertussis]CFW45203.1 Uncharacterised protein [Bordetella pertussis]
MLARGAVLREEGENGQRLAVLAPGDVRIRHRVNHFQLLGCQAPAARQRIQPGAQRRGRVVMNSHENSLSARRYTAWRRPRLALTWLCVLAMSLIICAIM